jgi:uncharacterized DUF497 family protein
MKFSWDPRKADSNLRKHGIAFDEAIVERVEDTIRIISARRATKDEIKDYEKNARHKIP